MLENVPAWLGKALRNVRAGHGKLAVARLGGEGLLGKDGIFLVGREARIERLTVAEGRRRDGEIHRQSRRHGAQGGKGGA